MEQTNIKRPGLVVFAAAFGAFIATFNETFFNVALVPIMNDLNVTAATAQWLVTANMLVAAVFVPIAGFLYKKISTRPMYLIAVGSLIVGSIVGLLSTSFPMVLAARIIQAIGAGMVPVVCMNMTLAVAPRGRLGTYIGIVGAMTTLGPSTSPLVSGIVLTFAPWQMLFAVYGLLCIACFIYGAVTLVPVSELTHPKLDIASTLLISVALVGIMYGISTAFSGSPVTALASALVGIVALVAFVHRQKRIDNPLIDLRPFSSVAFNVGALCVVLSLMSVFSMNIIMPTFMQESLGFTALSASVTLFPSVMCACIFAPIAGRVYDRLGIRYLAPGGMAVLLVFEVSLLALVRLCGMNTPAIWIAVLYAPVIAGAQFVIGPSQSFSLSSLARNLNTSGVTILSTGFQIAGCVGTSLFVGVYSLGETSALAGGAGAELASMNGFSGACILAVVVALAGVICGLVASHLEHSGAAVPVARESGEGIMQTSVLDSVMRRNTYVAKSSQSVYDALKCMVENHTSGVPVVDEGGVPVGFIDAGDIVRYVTGETSESPAYAMYMAWSDGADYSERMASLRTVNVMELAKRRVVVAEYSGGMEAACRALSQHSIKKVPVVQDGRVVGIVSRSDLTRLFFEQSFDEQGAPA